MDTVPQATDDLVTVTRWTARIIALALAAVSAIFISGSGLNPARTGIGGLLEIVAFGAMWAGLLVAFRWERLGGALTIAGLLLFFLLDFLFTGIFLKFWIFLLFAIPASLFLYCGSREHNMRDAGTE